MELFCCNCGKSISVRDSEYKRQLKKGRSWFACSRSCAQSYANRTRYLEKKSKFTMNKNPGSEVESYVLGFLCGDGTLGFRESNDGNKIHNVTLLSTDIEILEQIKDRLEYTGSIYKSKEDANIKTCYGLNFFADNARWFEGLGAVKDKDLWDMNNLKIADLGAFLRGFIDSDGSIRDDKRISVSILGRPLLLDQLEVVLQEYGFSKEVVGRGKVLLYQLSLYGRCKVVKFLSWLYEGATICMVRKRIKALSILATH